MTQCPIATDETYTYNFKATQYGHTWYHSHYSLQYPDGLAGPLLIHGPHSANWDEALDPVLMSDWSHRSAFQDFHTELGNPSQGILGKEPTMQSVLFDGVGASARWTHRLDSANYLTGNFTNCSSTDPCVPAEDRKPIFSKVFQKGKKYLLRLINSSTGSGLVFSIDGHLLEIITTDFVPIVPFKNESIHIGIGEPLNMLISTL